MIKIFTFAAMTSFNQTILCVDDDEDDLLFLRQVIFEINPDLKVVELKNGLEALSYLQNQTLKTNLPSLILLDVNMPFMDGKQTLEKIKEQDTLKDLPVVVLTNSQNPNDKAIFKKLGVEMYTKPLNLSALNMLLRQFILMYCS